MSVIKIIRMQQLLITNKFEQNERVKSFNIFKIKTNIKTNTR